MSKQMMRAAQFQDDVYSPEMRFQGGIARNTFSTEFPSRFSNSI